MKVDLRSDTITKPSKQMLEAMFNAQVGDDVFEEDPTVNLLEAKCASLFGMEAGLFCPSGSMTNQIAINIHTIPGSQVICDVGAHVYRYEGGGIALNSFSTTKTINGERMMFTAKDVEEALNPVDDIHQPVPSLICIENTTNRGGGGCWQLNEIEKIGKLCKTHKLAYHLDGARLFNAIVANGHDPKDFGEQFDTISICLSKGLGAPVGSVLLGTKEHILKARRIRKRLGGGMRQAGILAAAGIYALENNIDRLNDDHQRAKEIENVLKECSFVHSILPVETNIVIFEIKKDYPAKKFIQDLAKHDIHAFQFGEQQVRFVTHLDFNDKHLNKLILDLKRL